MFVSVINVSFLSVLFVGGYAINGSSFGFGDVPTVVGSINCSGTEQLLTDCQITNTAISRCNESTVAGIVCYGMLYLVINVCLHTMTILTLILLHAVFQEEANITCSNGAIRLADGLTEYEGRVEICYDNHWGGICGNSWDTTEATVVCRQLGHIFIGEMVLCAHTLPLSLSIVSNYILPQE